MISPQFTKAIKIVSERLNSKNLSWAFIGSTNCALQGMDLSPNDLDLVMRLEDLRQIPKILREYSPSNVTKLLPDPKDSAWTSKLANHPAYNVHTHIEGVDVQILGENDDGDYVGKLIADRLTYVPFNGLRLPCFTLEAEAEAYEETYRSKKAERIRQFLQARK